MLTITATMLYYHRACDDQLALFRATFGESTPLTPNVWARAQEVGLDVAWCYVLLPSPLQSDYRETRCSLRATYKAKCGPLLRDHDERHAPLWAKLRASGSPFRQAYRAYDAERAPMLAKYDAELAPLLHEYEAQLAAVLYTMLDTWHGPLDHTHTHREATP